MSIDRVLPREGKNSKVRWIFLLGLFALGAWIFSSFVTRAASLRMYSIPTGSMAPTLAPGDMVCVETDLRSAPRRGEIWVLKAPQTATTVGLTFVKRIIGLPGETIQVSAGRVLINGQPLDEPYIAAQPTYVLPPTKLGSREYFVLGDSRNTSNDSHIWGPVTYNFLIGRVICRSWPPQRIGGP